MKFTNVLQLLLQLQLLSIVVSFIAPPPPPASVVHRPRLFAAAADTTDDISSMRVKEIQSALQEMGVSYTDCFDKESLAQRLTEAREGKATPSPVAEATTTTTTTVTTPEPDSSSSPSPAAASPAAAPAASEFDRDAVLEELRGMRVKALRTECASRNIRWGNMIEKEDLVQALLKAREASSGFSSSGALTPGEVGMLTDQELDQELNNSEGATSSPLLLDIYATWCGPCQLMAPQLVEAAAELGDRVRVAKIDSDQFPEWSSKLKVQAFPTVLVFDASGKEVNRVEGALMKNQLVSLVEPYI